MEYDIPFETLKGKTLKKVLPKGDKLVFITKDGEKYVQYHSQECCEIVRLEDICGDLNDLLGSPLLMAEEVSNQEWIDHTCIDGYDYQSETWTFYKLATIKGYVTIRWYGMSNGCYSEKAKLCKLDKETPDHCF